MFARNRRVLSKRVFSKLRDESLCGTALSGRRARHDPRRLRGLHHLGLRLLPLLRHRRRRRGRGHTQHGVRAGPWLRNARAPKIHTTPEREGKRERERARARASEASRARETSGGERTRRNISLRAGRVARSRLVLEGRRQARGDAASSIRLEMCVCVWESIARPPHRSKINT